MERSEIRERQSRITLRSMRATVCAAMTNPTPVYIICSPRPRVGKTLLARLLVEFLRSNDRPFAGFDLHPREPGLMGHFPHFVSVIDLDDTQGQMALFDRLIANDLRTKVIDLGYAQFDRFFSVMWEIGFTHEARRRGVEPIVLFISDAAPSTVHAYAQLRRRFAATALVPVHNEQVSIMFSEQEFPPTRAECGIVLMPRLSPIVKGVIDRPSFSIATYMDLQPGGPTEIHEWIARIFVEFRELELRLLMSQLSSSLTPPPRRNRA
jgi:hypothetical protein